MSIKLLDNAYRFFSHHPIDGIHFGLTDNIFFLSCFLILLLFRDLFLLFSGAFVFIFVRRLYNSEIVSRFVERLIKGILDFYFSFMCNFGCRFQRLKLNIKKGKNNNYKSPLSDVFPPAYKSFWESSVSGP